MAWPQFLHLCGQHLPQSQLGPEEVDGGCLGPVGTPQIRVPANSLGGGHIQPPWGCGLKVTRREWKGTGRKPAPPTASSPGNPGTACSLHATASCTGQGPGWPWNLPFRLDSDQSLGSSSWVHSHPKAQPHLNRARTVMPVATHPRCPGSPWALHIFLGV